MTNDTIIKYIFLKGGYLNEYISIICLFLLRFNEKKKKKNKTYLINKKKEKKLKNKATDKRHSTNNDKMRHCCRRLHDLSIGNASYAT